jgi:hypothetical protein
VADEITISKTLKIRECGLKEGWLQDQIEKDPSILGLGDLEVVRREKTQSSGGRLDFLLKDSQDSADASMYEVEVMLGETDASHIIRTIEYWDLERRRWPKRTHTAVLVAENIERRFFNVVQLLSLTIPIIAIRANIVEAEGKRILNFMKILDVYQEPELEDRVSQETVDENYWQAKASWTLAHAKTLKDLFSRVLGEMNLHFNRHDIQLSHAGEQFIVLDRRRTGKSSFRIWLKNAETSVVTSMLDNSLIPYDVKPNGDDSDWQVIRLTIDQAFIQKNDSLFQEMAKFYQRSCQRTGEG